MARIPIPRHLCDLSNLRLNGPAFYRNSQKKQSRIQIVAHEFTSRRQAYGRQARMATNSGGKIEKPGNRADKSRNLETWKLTGRARVERQAAGAET